MRKCEETISRLGRVRGFLCTFGFFLLKLEYLLPILSFAGRPELEKPPERLWTGSDDARSHLSSLRDLLRDANGKL